MKKIPAVLVSEMRREMDNQKLPRLEQVEWFKWLRYYLDFCFKFEHSTRDPETEVLFLQKISSKGQSEEQQVQAAACISLFRKVAALFPAAGKEQDQVDELTDWGQVLVSLEEVIRFRQYAKTTSRTYRGWVLQFQEFLNSKCVADVDAEDAVRFLTWLATHKRVVSSTLLLANYDIRTIQEMMGHSDVKTTMIYTQTVPSRTLQNRKSPLDMDPDSIDL